MRVEPTSELEGPFSAKKVVVTNCRKNSKNSFSSRNLGMPSSEFVTWPGPLTLIGLALPTSDLFTPKAHAIHGNIM